jgi:hypothetical protein
MSVLGLDYWSANCYYEVKKRLGSTPKRGFFEEKQLLRVDRIVSRDLTKFG